MKLPKSWRIAITTWIASAVYIFGALLASGGLPQGPSILSALASRQRGTHHRYAKRATATPTPAPSPTPISQSSPASTPTSSGGTVPAAVKGSNPFAGVKLFVDPDSPAIRQVAAWKSSRPGDAALMQKIASQSVAIWLGDWQASIGADTKQWLSQMKAQGALPVFVLYNIPVRDCGSYSAGGASSGTSYQGWINAIQAATSGSKAVFILEPDALAGWDCLSAAQRNERAGLLRYAIDTLGTQASHYVYLDAGHAHWQSASEMSKRINSIGSSHLTGVSLNISNFYSTSETLAYGQQIGAQTGGLHTIIDTSRNGQGPAPGGVWCNPAGRGLGEAPKPLSGANGLDAALWIKYPGESDGACGGGAPTAGEWWPEYALGLASRSAF